MKKLLFIAALFAASITSNAQSYDTASFKPYAVVGLVNPIATSFQDTAKATFLHVTVNNDNLKDAASFHWVLFQKRWMEVQTRKTVDLKSDSTIIVQVGGKPLVAGDIKLNGADYKNWDGSNLFPFQFVAGKLGLAIK